MAESRRLAAVPVRPAWRDSDPRWRRRMLAGVWLLALMPLMVFLRNRGLDNQIPVPGLFPIATVSTLGDTLLGGPYIYEPVVFCTGVALLFSKERGRRRERLDRVRGWGVLGAYVVALLVAAGAFFLFSLILVGIGALFQSMPPKFQPAFTPLLVKVSSAYLRYGPQPAGAATDVTVAVSSLTVLLALVSLRNAIRSCGSASAVRVLLAPLAVAALVHLGLVARDLLRFGGLAGIDVGRFELFFNPGPVDAGFYLRRFFGSVPPLDELEVRFEQLKWLAVVGIAVWLTAAQARAWAHALRRRRDPKPAGASPPAPGGQG